MKKNILMFILILIFPLFISAEEVDEIFITSADKATINKTIDITLNVTYKGFDKESTSGYGLGGYKYQLDFDSSVFVPIKVSENDYFNTNIYKDEKSRYYLVATIKNDGALDNKCSDKTLYCSNIKDTITFGVKSTKEEKTTFKIYGVSSFLYKIGSNLQDKDRVIIDSIKNTTKTLTIVKSKDKNISNKDIASDIKSSNIETMVESKIQDYKTQEDIKSNNYLSSLEVKGYDISFDKHMLAYDINIKSNVNSIEVTVKTESERAKVQIVGNDDLSANNNVVTITVTSEDGQSKIYKINAVKENKTKEETQIETKEDIKDLFNGIKSKFNKKNIKLLEMIGIIIIAVVVIVLIIRSIINNKLNKKLKDL